MRWKDDPARTLLLSLYARADELVRGATCACAAGEEGPRKVEELAPCCHFGLTGREPYPTAVELTEILHAVRARGARKAALRPRHKLPLADDPRRCPLLSDEGRCTIYASRPLGCRTFFCNLGEGPPKDARAGLLEVARRIADLSAKVSPRDPLPRPLTGALRGVV